MAPVAELLDSGEVGGTDYLSSRIRLKESASVRDSIALANDAVELRSWSEVIPSMNDIFIRAVEGKL